MEQGQMHVYLGDGKGKSTAAIGLAVRCLGAGKTVYMGQFIRDMEYHEIHILNSIEGFKTELYGTGEGCFLTRRPKQKDIDAAAAGVEKIREAMLSGRYDLVIADEINVAWTLNLVTEEQMLSLAEAKPDTVELVFTGRGCPQSVLDKADLVTEMKEIKHYYHTKKLLARDGIER